MVTPDRYLPPGYDVAKCRWSLAGVDVALFQIADPNALADAVGPEVFAEDERFPYWAELWPSAVALATFLLRRGVDRGTAALELGCGLGLVGVAAALAGAEVLFTDFDPAALAFARANHALNLGRPGEARLLDWRAPPQGLSAPLVLAADVLYERRFLEPFVDTLRHTVASGGTALVAEPGRTIAEGTVEQLATDGFRYTLHLEEIALGGRVHPVWIHELQRPVRGQEGAP